MSENRIDKYKNKLKEIQSKRSQFWQPEEGNNLIRILPGLTPSDDFYLEANVHYIKGMGDQGRATSVKCLGDDCAVCEAVSRLESSDDPDDQLAAKDARTVSTFYMNIVDLNKIEAGTIVWRVSSSQVMTSLLEALVDPEWGDFAHPEKGRNIKIRMEKRGGARAYDVSLKPKESSIDPSFLKKRKNLNQFVPSSDAKFIRKAAEFLGGGSSQREDDEDYQSAKSSVKKPFLKKKLLK